MMTVRELLVRLKGAIGLGRRDRDLAEELAFHREALEEQHRAQGLDAPAARRAAHLALGGDAQIADAWRDQRSVPSLDALRQDVRYGLRMLRRTPGFTVAALTTLTLGIGANTAIFTVVDAVLLKPLPYADPDRLVVLGDRGPDGSLSGAGFATVNDWRERSRSVEQLALMRLWMPTLVSDGAGERLPAVRVSWNYFDVLGARVALGRGFTADDDRADGWRVAVLSDRLWRRRFGADPSIVGRTVALQDQAFRVIGIMPASFEPLDAQRFFNTAAEIWVPIGNDQAGCRRRCRPILGLGRLKAGVTIAAATAEMNGIHDELRREYPGDYQAGGAIAVVSMRQALTGHVRTALYVLLAAVGFVLLIACANVANLLLARSVTRGREIALRAALGAGRARIARQLLTESLLLGAGGALGGLLFAIVAVRGLAAIAPVTLPRLEHAAIDSRVLAFTAVIAVLTSVLFGLAPAWRAGAAGAPRALACDSRGSTGGRSRGRAVLVVADLVLALVLLAGAGLMIRTVAALTHAPRGFDVTRILTLQFSLTGRAFGDEAMVAFQQRAVDRIGAIPGVERVALAGQIPFARAGGGAGDCWGFHAAGRMKPNPADDPCIERFGITPDYFTVMSIPVLSGRAFTDADTAGAQRVILVSQSTAKAIWGEADPIGSQVRIGNAARGLWWTVIGVVGDVHADDLTAPVVPAMYTQETQITSAYLTAIVKASSDDPAALAASVRDALRELDPAVPVYEVATLSSLVDRASAQRLFVTRLLVAFAFVAILLAAVGLYGVVSYGVAQRTREVGVRIALGARRRDVLRLVLSGGLSLVAIGVAAGLAAAFVATRFLGALVFGVSPVDPLTFAAATLLLALVALAAHWMPARRALRIDPARALRAE